MGGVWSSGKLLDGSMDFGQLKSVFSGRMVAGVVL